jgi:Zinc knuckle
LDLPPGKDIAHGTVTKWMGKLKEYSMTTYKSRISMIFGPDGTLGEYPVYAIPDQPGEEASVYDRKIWELERAEYNKNNKTLEEDKGNLYGAMLGQMSDSSKTRVGEVQLGVEAENEFEPRKLLQAILVTHIGDSTLGVPHQMFMITQRYNNLVMAQHENLSTYLTNTKSALTAIQQAYEMVGRGGLDEVYPESQMAVKFILGLNNNYVEFKSFYTNGLKTWPDCLETAYQDTAKFNPKRAAGNSPAAMERANAFAMTGKGGKSGKGGYPGGHKGKSAPNARWVKDGADSPEGEKSDKGSPVGVYISNKSPPAGYKRGPCNNCGKYGHLARECRSEAADTVAQYWTDEGGKSPGGKSTTPPGKGK